MDFLPADVDNPPPVPPDIDIFLDPFFGAFNVPGDLGEIDFSIVIPGGPTIPATGLNIIAPQGGLIKLTLMAVAAPFFIIETILQSILDLSPALPDLTFIVDLLNDLALTVGLSGLAVSNFILCFAAGCLDIIETIIPI